MVPGRVYLHDVSMIVIGVEGAYQEEEDHLTTTWHVGCPYSINRHKTSLTPIAHMSAPPFSRTAHPLSLTLLFLLGYITFRYRKGLHSSYDVRANPDLDRLYHIMQPPDSPFGSCCHLG